MGGLYDSKIHAISICDQKCSNLEMRKAKEGGGGGGEKACEMGEV